MFQMSTLNPFFIDGQTLFVQLAHLALALLNLKEQARRFSETSLPDMRFFM